MDKLDKALVFACEMHNGQVRKGGNNQPYIFHPLEVMCIASNMTLDEDVLVGALLHDTIEDTPATYEKVKELFGERVADLVSDESEDKRIGTPKKDTWHERKVEAINKLKEVKDEGALIICLSDKIANLRSFRLLKYRDKEKMWDFFNMKDPKEHKWYYEEVGKALSSLSKYPIYYEYIDLINDIFEGE